MAAAGPADPLYRRHVLPGVNRDRRELLRHSGLCRWAWHGDVLPGAEPAASHDGLPLLTRPRPPWLACGLLAAAVATAACGDGSTTRQRRPIAAATTTSNTVSEPAGGQALGQGTRPGGSSRLDRRDPRSATPTTLATGAGSASCTLEAAAKDL